MKSEATREEWGRRVGQWQKSGLNAVEFGAAAGINPGLLRQWKWRLGNGTSPKSALAPSQSRFVEVRPAGGEALELVLTSGFRIRVPANFDADSLRRLVATLDGR